MILFIPNESASDERRVAIALVFRLFSNWDMKYRSKQVLENLLSCRSNVCLQGAHVQGGDKLWSSADLILKLIHQLKSQSYS